MKTPTNLYRVVTLGSKIHTQTAYKLEDGDSVWYSPWETIVVCDQEGVLNA